MREGTGWPRKPERASELTFEGGELRTIPADVGELAMPSLRDRHIVLVPSADDSANTSTARAKCRGAPRLRLIIAGSSVPSAWTAGYAHAVTIQPALLTQIGARQPQSMQLPASCSAKIMASVAAVARAGLATGRPPAPTAVLWRALIRSIATALHLLDRRSDDTWLHPDAIARVVAIIDANISEDLPVGSLARTAGLGASAFLRAFRGSLGETPGDFVLGRRLSVAERLLRTTAMPIRDVAAAVGFATPAHFAATFRMRFGRTPSAHRLHEGSRC